MLALFACARYRFVLTATTPLQLRAFAGTTLRGGFGYVFKRTVCIWPPGDCARCLLKHTCSYPYVFETAPPPGATKLRGLEQVPRPFVLEAPVGVGSHRYAPGERFDFRLVLIGRAIDYLPYFVFTFAELGRTGLGAGRGQFTVAEIHAEGRAGSRCVYTAAEGVLRDGGERLTGKDLAMEPPPVQRLGVRFQTPTRIQTAGAMRSAIRFEDLVRALLRRLSSLMYFHCGCELHVDFKALIERAGQVRTVESTLGWQEQSRFSTRQEQRIEMGGVVGRVVYEAADAAVWEVYLPLLGAGEWVHVGKGAVMGLGKYRLEAG
jgi:hypothetical protein